MALSDKLLSRVVNTVGVVCISVTAIRLVLIETNQQYLSLSKWCNLSGCLEQMEGDWGDYASYMRAGFDLANYGTLQPGNEWIFNLWPPGMPLLWGVSETLSTDSTPTSAVVLAIIVTLWIVAASLPVLFARQIRWKILAIIVAELMLVSPAGQNWLLSGKVFYSETTSYALMYMSLTLLAQAIFRQYRQRTRLFIASLAGFFGALAAYTRAAMDISLLLGLSGILALSLIVVVTRGLLSARGGSTRAWQRVLTVFVTSLGIFLIITLPWRVVVAAHTDSTPKLMIPNTQQQWINGWIPSDRWSDPYFVNVGINGFCVSFSEKCQDIRNLEEATERPYSGSGFYSAEQFQEMAFEAVSTSPWAWAQDRWMVMRASIKDALSPAPLTWILVYVSSWFILLAGLPPMRNMAGRLAMLGLGFLLTVGQVLPAVISSMEPRYFYFAQFIPLMLLGSLAGASASAHKASPEDVPACDLKPGQGTIG